MSPSSPGPWRPLPANRFDRWLYGRRHEVALGLALVALAFAGLAVWLVATGRAGGVVWLVAALVGSQLGVLRVRLSRTEYRIEAGPAPRAGSRSPEAPPVPEARED